MAGLLREDPDVETRLETTPESTGACVSVRAGA
jgi:hypothetical protein